MKESENAITRMSECLTLLLSGGEAEGAVRTVALPHPNDGRRAVFGLYDGGKKMLQLRSVGDAAKRRSAFAGDLLIRGVIVIV